MDSEETIDGHTGGCRGCDTPLLSLLLVNPATISYHLVESAIYHLVDSPIFVHDSMNSAIVCTQ